MVSKFIWRALAVLALPLLGFADPAADIERRSALSTCLAIKARISSSSDVIYLLSLDYEPNIRHYFQSSTQIPACVLKVGSDADVAAALQLIARDKTPFAIRSGGHASNPGFSSTTGVHISLSNMKQVELSPDKSRCTIGMGQIWSDVYRALTPSGVNVVGGRVPGPGVGGFTLGGGYSWKTNQYGLTSDTVESFNLVLPNATITKVDATKPDLFFALKGGMNRFGVVTSATYKTHPQAPTIYGGIVIYVGDSVQKVLDATAKFDAENKDPKAQVITTLSGAVTGATSIILYFYDGPSKPAAFAPFDGIIGTLDTRRSQSFADFVAAIPALLSPNPRGSFHTMSTTKATQNFVNAVRSETEFYGKQMLAHGGLMISYDIEPFLDTFGQFDTAGAWPHANSPLPLNIYFSWLSSSEDAFWTKAMRTSAAKLKQIAMQEGIYPSGYPTYPNYAIAGTTAEELYGAANAQRLRSIRDQIDPGRIMDLAGGFII